MGLRTRESIRAFQKSEKLPATGRLDPQTAGKLGVNPESIRRNADGAKRRTVEGKAGNQVAEGKPWAGTILAKTARRTSTLPKVSSAADPENNREKRRENGLREQ
jgi:peptidoglycan hydrolase-like protein with peptidoglycan-binding domain